MTLERRRSSPFGSKLAITLGSTLIIAFANILVYKLAATIADPSTYYLYTVVRRATSFLVPVLALGFGVSIVVYMAGASRQRSARRLLSQQLKASLVISAALAIVNLGVVGIVLGEWSISRIVLLAVALSISLNMTAMIFAFRRGQENFWAGAKISVFANAAFPIFAAAFLSKSLEVSILVWALLNCVWGLRALKRIGSGDEGLVHQDARDFWRRSVARLPGDAAYAAIFFLPVMMVAGGNDVNDLAVFNFYFVLVGLLTTAVTPFALVILPMVRRRVVLDGRTAALVLLVGSLAAGLIGSGGMVTLQILQPELIIKLFMSDSFLTGAEVLATLWPATIGIGIFLSLKSVVDGLSETPWTAFCALLGLVAFFAVASREYGGLDSGITAVNVSFGVLGGSVIVTAVGLMIRDGEKQ